MRIRMTVHLFKYGRAALDFWLAPVCAICQSPVDQRLPLCQTCALSLQAQDGLSSTLLEPQQAKAGPTMPWHVKPADRICFYQNHYSLFEWSRYWSMFFKAWKFTGDRHLHYFFRSPLRSVLPLLQKQAYDRCFVIASAKSALRQRGYQPLGDLAKWLGNCLKIPVSLDISKRHRQHQSHSSFTERFWQMHDALQLQKKIPGLAGTRVLLLEDIYTTGATANEAARVLRQNGVAQVDVLSLVYRPGYLPSDTGFQATDGFRAGTERSRTGLLHE